MLDTYQALLRAFADQAGLDADSLVATGEVALGGVEGGVTVRMSCRGSQVRGELVLLCDLGMPPRARRLALYESLLEANHLWLGTGGATLGVEPGTGHVVACERLDLQGLGASGLASALAEFVEACGAWRDFIDQARPQVPAALPVRAVSLS